MIGDIGWLLIMGLGQEAGHWGEVPALLKGAFPGSTVLCPDLPGTGARWKGIAPRTAQETVSIARSDAMKQGFLGAEDSGRKWIVIGLSLGAMIGWEWLLAHPEDFCGGVFINMSLPKVNPVHRRLTPYGYRKFLRAGAERSAVKRQAAILELVSNSFEVRQGFISAWVNIQQARPVSTANVCRQLLATQNIQIPEKKPDASILLVVSEKDRMVSPKCSYEIRDRWSLPLVAHPWAGHCLNCDDPEWLVQKIQAWVTSDNLEIQK
jgi:pimeloyl-ACP methyl ester carboxylesterase